MDRLAAGFKTRLLNEIHVCMCVCGYLYMRVYIGPMCSIVFENVPMSGFVLFD